VMRHIFIQRRRSRLIILDVEDYGKYGDEYETD
jgi:hypothetical protein